MQRSTSLFLLVPALVALGSDAQAQSVIVPNASANTRGPSGLNSLVRDTGQARTYMHGIPAAELTQIPVGSVINGVSFRSFVGAASPASWPTVDTTWSSYEVTVGNAIPLATWTTTLMSNFATTPLPPVLVRTGPMVVEPAVWLNNTSLPAPQPNPFGDFFWDFQKPFLYTGGDLALLFTHPGSNQAASFTYHDYVTSPPGAVAYTASTFQSVTGVASTSFLIPRIHYGYGAGCPGTGGMTPNLVQSNNVTGGGNVTFAIANAPASTVAIYVIGATAANLPLPNGCTLLATPTIVFTALLSPKGRNALPASFPPGLALTAYVQAFVIDAGAAGGYTATNGVTLTVNP